MQPGNIPPQSPQPAPVEAYPGVNVATAPMVEENHLAEIEQHRQENVSKMTAVGIAVLAHVLLGLLLTLIVMAVLEDSPPELIVESAGAGPTPPTIQKEEFSKKVTKDKPSPPSETSQVIVANIASPIAVPMVDTITDNPVIGDATNGMGFGAGGFQLVL